MTKTPFTLPTDIAALQAMVVARDQMIEAREQRASEWTRTVALIF